MRTVIAALLGAMDLRILESATSDSGVEVINHATGERLLETLATRSVVLVVVDAVDGAGRSASPLIERVRAQRSALPILAICSPSASGSSAVLEAARAGVSGLIFRGVDDSGFVIRQAI
jgi:DNA-binding NarL/FixJ family response regulator